jgi:hypothetical protein
MKHDSIQTETEALHALRLTSSEPSQSPSQLQYILTPSIFVSKLDTVNDLPGRSDSLMKGLDALYIKDHRSTTVSGSSEVNKCSSPSPSHRRRFASAVSMRHDRVEDEDPPQSPFHMPEVQQALSDVRSVVSRMLEVLSASKLHLGCNSSVCSL